MPRYVSFPVIGGEPLRGATRATAAALQAAGERSRPAEGAACATIDPARLAKPRRDRGLAPARQAPDIVRADGAPVDRISEVGGGPAGLAPGSERVDRRCALAARIGAPIAMLGSTEAALSAAGEKLVRRPPGPPETAAVSPPTGGGPTGARGRPARRTARAARRSRRVRARDACGKLIEHTAPKGAATPS